MNKHHSSIGELEENVCETTYSQACTCKEEEYNIILQLARGDNNKNDTVEFKIQASPLDTVVDIKKKILSEIEGEEDGNTTIDFSVGPDEYTKYLYLMFEKCETLYNESIYEKISNNKKNITLNEIKSFCENVKVSPDYSETLNKCSQKSKERNRNQLEVLDAYNEIVQLGLDNVMCLMKLPMGVKFKDTYCTHSPINFLKQQGEKCRSVGENKMKLAQYGNIYRNNIYVYVYKEDNNNKYNSNNRTEENKYDPLLMYYPDITEESISINNLLKIAKVKKKNNFDKTVVSSAQEDDDMKISLTQFEIEILPRYKVNLYLPNLFNSLHADNDKSPLIMLLGNDTKSIKAKAYCDESKVQQRRSNLKKGIKSYINNIIVKKSSQEVLIFVRKDIGKTDNDTGIKDVMYCILQDGRQVIRGERRKGEGSTGICTELAIINDIVNKYVLPIYTYVSDQLNQQGIYGLSSLDNFNVYDDNISLKGSKLSKLNTQNSESEIITLKSKLNLLEWLCDINNRKNGVVTISQGSQGSNVGDDATSQGSDDESTSSSEFEGGGRGQKNSTNDFIISEISVIADSNVKFYERDGEFGEFTIERQDNNRKSICYKDENNIPKEIKVKVDRSILNDDNKLLEKKDALFYAVQNACDFRELHIEEDWSKKLENNNEVSVNLVVVNKGKEQRQRVEAVIKIQKSYNCYKILLKLIKILKLD